MIPNMLGKRCPALLLILLSSACFASSDQPESALSKANRLSSLTGPGAIPFHLKVRISEPSNPKSPYVATVEQYWKSRDDWSSAIDSNQFHQRVMVRAGNRTEENFSDYYPLWLRDFVMAALNPFEDSSFWEKVSARMVISKSINGHPSTSCARAQFKVGTATVNNDAFAVICFNADGTLASFVRPGYDMEFHDSQPFGEKRIAYRYVDDPEPGTELVGRVEVLEKIEPSAVIPDFPSLSQQTSDPLKSIPISQETFETLLDAPININWPAVHSGNTQGKLSMYVSADRDGTIREAYPLNSDNAGLQDAARDQLLKIRLKPAVLQGIKVQTEAALTFQFSTRLESASEALPQTPSPTAVQSSTNPVKPITVSPMIANAFRLKAYAPVYPQDLKLKRVGGTVELMAIIGKEGQIISLSPISSPNDELTSAALAAVQRWLYKPYLLNGQPVEIQTKITVIFQAP
jgi:TonB family protein